MPDPDIVIRMFASLADMRILFRIWLLLSLGWIGLIYYCSANIENWQNVALVPVAIIYLFGTAISWILGKQ
jgi:hypothetical protein